MIVKAGLVIDLGNSETRVNLLSGSNAYRFNMSNKFVELPPQYNVNKKYVNGKSTVFEYGGVFYANGLIVEREFVGQEMRPSALQSKTEQLVTDLTLNLAIIKAFSVLSLANNLPPTSLDVTFNISVLLPPLDHEVNEAKMVEIINRLKSVNSLLPVQLNVNFKVGDVAVNPEAVSAYFGAFYEEDGLKDMPQNRGKSLENGDVLVRDNGNHLSLVEVEANKKFMNGYVLVLDIGAGTTDVALFKDTELVEKSKETFTRGGNTVESVALTEIKKKFGYTPLNMKRVIAEGLLEEGTQVHDVSEIVTYAKQLYSKSMMSDLRTYLEGLGVSMPVVKGLLVTGGGSLSSRRYIDSNGNLVTRLLGESEDGKAKISINGNIYNDEDVPYTEQVVSPAMSEVLLQYLKQLAPSLETVSTEGKDLRELNSLGALYLHKYS